MARPNVKTHIAAQMIRKRISHGDHALHGIPPERLLADELGISRVTLRRSLKLLETEGLLMRGDNGRIQVATEVGGGARQPVIGIVKHGLPALDHNMWTAGIHMAAEGLGVTLHAVSFEHYASPHLAAALSGLDGMFFLPPAEQIPRWLVEKIHEMPCRVVVLDQDASEQGLPSISMFPPKAESRLLGHLLELGHRHIDCLNTQRRNAVIDSRISCWEAFLQEWSLEGTLHSLEEATPLESAYQLVGERLREGEPFGTALLCTTSPAAMGAIRAFYEAGVVVGREVSVCAVNDEGTGPYMIPSLTSLRSAPRALYLRAALTWMLSKAPWQGPMLLQPAAADIPLFIGESSGPAIPPRLNTTC